jgi:hypothetical protein
MRNAMSIRAKTLFMIFCTLLGAGQAQAQYVNASSEMRVENLRFSFANPNALWQWTDEWLGNTRAHAADSDSSQADEQQDFLGNDGAIQTIANTAHVHSQGDYKVVNGGQAGLDGSAGVTGITHSDLELIGPNKQADGTAVSDLDNFFTITDTSNPSSAGPVEVVIEMDFSGNIFGAADDKGFFVDITHLAKLQLSDSLTGDLLASDFFQDSISGANTTINRDHSGALRLEFTLHYNTEYYLFVQADSEIYGYTIPSPTPLALMLAGAALPWRRHYRKKR